MQTTQKHSGKVECVNPNTGGRLHIDAPTYELFAKAISHSLAGDRPLTYTQLVTEIKDCFRKQKTAFNGSVGWYAVTVKNDLQAKGVIAVFTERGKKLHRLFKEERNLPADGSSPFLT